MNDGSQIEQYGQKHLLDETPGLDRPPPTQTSYARPVVVDTFNTAKACVKVNNRLLFQTWGAGTRLPLIGHPQIAIEEKSHVLTKHKETSKKSAVTPTAVRGGRVTHIRT